MPLDGNIYVLKCLIAYPILRNIYFVMFIYWKPGESVDEINAFLAELLILLQRVKNLNKLFYICEDYNIDLLKTKINPRFDKFFDHIISSRFLS